ncbi:MAG: hypothetical protein VW268_05825 [Rhodospirillaceae bacterium]
MNRNPTIILPAALALALFGASPVSADDKEQANTPAAGATMHHKDTGKTAQSDDPLDSVNRVTSSFNSFVRKNILDPLVEG